MDRARTVVVIGPGPSGATICGADVDRHTVVRMWNHDWQPTERYGVRFDHGMITTTQNARLATRRPATSWFFYNVPHEPEVSTINGDAVFVLDHMRWFHRATAMGAMPGSPRRALKFTRGFAAVAAVIEHLRPGCVVVIGMDVLRDGVTGSRYLDSAALPYYVKSYPELAKLCPGYATDDMPAGLLRNGPHDYAVEAVLIRALAAEAGTEIAWGF